jgi:Glycosyl transferase family 2
VNETALDVERLLSGQSGVVTGPRARTRAHLRDALDAAALWARLVPPRLDRAARAGARGSVVVLGLYAAEQAEMAASAVAELRRSARKVTFALGALDEPDPSLAEVTAASGLRGRGKFENLNALLERASGREADWIVVVDDDVELPSRFLDRMLFCAEQFGFDLAQPAVTHTSHSAWPVCRRERGIVARRTRLVEIGPVTAFRRTVVPALLPFPSLRMGWGLDLHWGGLALERGWRLGIVDAAAIRHEARITASTYNRDEAVAELTSFLAARPHIDRVQAGEVVERHRSWE